jgi:glycosyltransferase involved in cell wall biosynthesis
LTSTPTLSLLVPTLPSRAAFLRRLRAQLEPQIAARPVELLTLMDDGSTPTGTKRNQLVEMASGRYVAFIDDDDRVSPDYVQTLLDGCAQDVDAVCIRGEHRLLGSPRTDEFIDIPYQLQGHSTVGGRTTYLRGAQHLDALRREIALAVLFPPLWVDEDRQHTRALHLSELIQTWHSIPHATYFYDDLCPRPAATAPRLAIVMPCFGHADVTLRSVESLMEATTEPSFRLILIDDGSPDEGETASLLAGLQFRWPDRITVWFNHANLGVNATWNVGIALAYAMNAEHLAIVNNDLVFSPSWEQPLLSALEDPRVGVVSPMSTFGPEPPPDWPRGGLRQVNPAGYLGYMPLLGAAFVSRLALWDRLGPIPETMRIYWGDNWIAQGAQNLGLEVGYDHESYVHHLFCVTTAGLDNSEIWPEDSAAYHAAVESRGWAALRPFCGPDEIDASAHVQQRFSRLLRERQEVTA